MEAGDVLNTDSVFQADLASTLCRYCEDRSPPSKVRCWMSQCIKILRQGAYLGKLSNRSVPTPHKDHDLTLEIDLKSSASDTKE